MANKTTRKLRFTLNHFTGLRLPDLEGGQHTTLAIRVEGGRPDTVTPTRRGLRTLAWTGSTTFDLLDESGEVLRRMEVPEIAGPRPVIVSADGRRLATS